MSPTSVQIQMNFASLQLIIFFGWVALGAIAIDPGREIHLKHPLAPLDAHEIQATSSFIRAQHPEIEKFLFVSITLVEPPKQLLNPFLEDDAEDMKDSIPYHAIPRKSFTVFIDGDSGRAYEVILNLSPTPVEEEFTKLSPGIQPMCTMYEEDNIQEIIRNDPNVVRRLNNLGFTNMNLIQGHPWITQFDDDPKYRQHRLTQVFLYFHEYEEDNELEHPLNFAPVVDLIAKKVIFIQDFPLHKNFTIVDPDWIVQFPFKESKYGNATMPRTRDGKFYRNDTKPIRVQMPQGRSFSVSDDGWGISWQKFNLRLSFNYREGVVLHDVYYRTHKGRRPLLYRASIGEMIVPYGDPRPPYHYKRAMDIGSHGGGFNANPLEFGVDCFPHGHLIDTVLNDHNGLPLPYPGAICVQEEDAGLLHKHSVNNTVRTVARAVRLTIHTVLTVGNYDYAFMWILHQDATIQFEAKLTGILSTNLVAPSVHHSPYGTILSPQVLAQNHQHLLCARLDTQFDGEMNTVSVLDVHSVEDADMDGDGVGDRFSHLDPSGHGFVVKETVLKREQEAITDNRLETDRTWKISNPNIINSHTGKPVAWKLYTMNTRQLLSKPGSFNWKIAQFAAHTVWVTKFHEHELYPAGFYANQVHDNHPNGDGLPVYAADNEDIDNEDIVLWHSFGTTHIPRLEDFPIMAVVPVGFSLKPNNFFHNYPGLDVPPPSVV